MVGRLNPILEGYIDRKLMLIVNVHITFDRILLGSNDTKQNYQNWFRFRKVRLMKGGACLILDVEANKGLKLSKPQVYHQDV